MTIVAGSEMGSLWGGDGSEREGRKSVASNVAKIMVGLVVWALLLLVGSVGWASSPGLIRRFRSPAAACARWCVRAC